MGGKGDIAVAGSKADGLGWVDDPGWYIINGRLADWQLVLNKKLDLNKTTRSAFCEIERDHGVTKRLSSRWCETI